MRGSMAELDAMMSKRIAALALNRKTFASCQHGVRVEVLGIRNCLA